MATQEEWICTETMQTDLVKLYESDKKKWRIETSKMIREHPSKFSILTVGTTDDGDNLYSFDEFCSHFEASMNNKQLLQLIYDDINVNNDEHIKFIAIHRWVNNVKKQKQSEIIKDHKWLFTKILHVQAAHLDADGSGEVDKDEFVNYFVHKIGFPQFCTFCLNGIICSCFMNRYIADAMFADIDKDGDGNLSVMEYTRWKNKHNKPIKLDKFLDKVEKEKDTKKPKKATERVKKVEQNDDSKNDLNDTKQSLNASKTKSNDTQQSNNRDDENEKKIKALNEKIASLIKINDNLLNENREKQKENAEMNEKLTEFQTKNEELNREINEKNNQIVMIQNNQSKSVQNVQSELDELKRKYEALTVEKNKNEKTLKNECSENESTIKLLQTENREKQKENAEMNEKMNELKTKNEELNKEINDKYNQIVIIESNQSSSIKSVRSELSELKIKYDALAVEKNENDKTLKKECSESESRIKLLQTENEKLRKKLKKEQNHLAIVLRADSKRIEKEKEMERQRVVKIAVLDKNDLSKLDVQIEIINSDFYRMKSMMLLAKYEKVEGGKYYGFLDFVQKDLSEVALKNVCNKLKIMDKIGSNKIAPLLSVVVKIYTMRLYKLKTGDSINRSEYKSDRRVVEHFCVWLIRSKSMKMDQMESVRVLNDSDIVISGEYSVYNGQISLKQFQESFAKWCKEYVECNGCHLDSKLKQ